MVVVDVVLDVKTVLVIVKTVARVNAIASRALMTTRAVDQHVHVPIAIVQLANVQSDKCYLLLQFRTFYVAFD
ncbi:unnamed protein product [Adineta ricciae]|uniref:Uncharacterized protein n=1 Tax=Adineta ricciae TaxID=249248 RepID=A0A816FPP6_ADIRI|nr:unnamed protein product [Adineta ricciae]